MCARGPFLAVILTFGLSAQFVERVQAQDSPDEAELWTAYRQAEAYRKEGRTAEAIKEYERAVDLAPRVFGPNAADTAALLGNLASLYRDVGQYARAEPLLQRSLQITEERLGKDHPEVATCLNELGLVYQFMGQYDRAETLYQRALEIREARLGKDHTDVAESLHYLAYLYRIMGQYARAETLFQRSLQIFEDKLGKDHTTVASCLKNLADVYSSMGEYSKAEPLYQRSLQIQEDKLGKDHTAVATSLSGLAGLYAHMGQYARAEPLYQRSLRIYEARLGKDHTTVAVALNDLAVLYEDLGQYTRAESLFQRSLQIRENKLGKDHPGVARSLNNLAELYEELGQDDKAEPLLQRSLEISENKLGKDHPVVATCLDNLGRLYEHETKYTRAEPLLQRSLEIREARLGKDHPSVALTLGDLARLYKDIGQDEKAETLYQRALQIYEARLGQDHPDVADTLSNLAALHALREQWQEAFQTMDRARHLFRRHITGVLPGLSEREQLTFLTFTQDADLHAALSLGLLRGQEEDLVACSAGWVLNGKALAQESLAERALLARDRSDSRLGDLSQRLLDVRKQLATLTMAPPAPGQEDSHRQRLQQLAEQEQELSVRLAQARGGSTLAEPWVELSAVRKALPSDSVLIDMARFYVLNFQARSKEGKWQPARYAAWVIPPQGKGTVHLIDLGPAERIEKAVQTVRNGLRAAQGSPEHPSTIQELGEPEAEQQMRKALAALAELVLRPLAEHIDPSEHWIISPDASLWLVPWAALPLTDDSYAIEKHRISYVVSGRDLVATPYSGKAGRSMILADPDYDLGLDRARSETEDLIARSGSIAELRGLSASLHLPRVQRLPGTAAEAQAVAPKLQRYVQREPWLFTGKQALEGVFKAVRHPQVVMFSTHGFFLEDQEVPQAKSAGLDEKHAALTNEGKPLENPLLRCGLLLAGCNNRDQAQERDEDGVLTGLEIVGTDLRGTDLVVLSACETGLGEVHNGEGVAGLRQAFQLAGARSVVATLWQIPDRDSARLMSDFFANLAAGKGKADALRDAQLALIKAHRDRKGGAHPFFWAAFTLTGE